MNRAIIVGGGVIGLSTAYHLARKRFGRVILLEKEVVGDGASMRAAGIITGLLWSETGVRVRKLSLQRFRELSEELEGYRFQDVGCLNLFDEASWEERKALLPLYDRLGAPYEILSPQEMRRAFPILSLPDNLIGLYDPLGGYSEPHEYIPALANGARKLGVEIREHQQVGRIVTKNGHVTGVETAQGILEGDVVISTVYAWTPLLLASVGLRLPVKFFVHQRYVTEPLPLPGVFPAVNANPLHGYIRPAAGGTRALVGVESATREEFRVPDMAWRMTALEAPPALKQMGQRILEALLPIARGVPLASDHIGLLAFSIDGEPVMGPVAALPGLIVATSFHSGDFAYNPAVGYLLAEMVADGRPGIDIGAFSPDRYADIRETDEYLATTLTQNKVVRRRH